MVYGLNEINVPILSIPALVVLEVLNPFYIFQIYALTLWVVEEYYYYSVAIAIMSVFGISSSVLQTHQVIITIIKYFYFLESLQNINSQMVRVLNFKLTDCPTWETDKFLQPICESKKKNKKKLAY